MVAMLQRGALGSASRAEAFATAHFGSCARHRREAVDVYEALEEFCAIPLDALDPEFTEYPERLFPEPAEGGRSEGFVFPELAPNPDGARPPSVIFPCADQLREFALLPGLRLPPESAGAVNTCD